MRRAFTRLSSTLYAAMLMTCGLSASNAHAAPHACRVPDFPQDVQCGSVSRPLDPSQPDGKKIDIHFVVVPSQDRNKLQDAVFLLAGGPGQSAINVAGWGEYAFGRLNRRRDLVFVDQRGTGQSAPLHCPDLESNAELLDSRQTAELAGKCLQRLQALPYGDLRQFTTTIAVQDLEAVRLAQGYARINLVGISYGTRAALEYMRQFPQAVRRVVLDGVVPPDQALPTGDAQRALDAMFAGCLSDLRCDAAYPDLRRHWEKLLQGLPRQISFIHPRLGSEVQVRASRDLVVSMVHKSLYGPSSAAGLPFAIMQAEQGKFDPLVALSGATSLPGPAGVAYGMHFSVWCAEEYGRMPPKSEGEFGEAMEGMYRQVCAQWPRGKVPADFYTLPASPVPVLLLSGGIDPVTPSEHAEQVAKALGPQALHLKVQNAGHGLMSQGSCARDLAYRFLNARSWDPDDKLDVSCLRQIPRPLAWRMPQPQNGAVQTAQDQQGVRR